MKVTVEKKMGKEDGAAVEKKGGISTSILFEGGYQGILEAILDSLLLGLLIVILISITVTAGITHPSITSNGDIINIS